MLMRASNNMLMMMAAIATGTSSGRTGSHCAPIAATTSTRVKTAAKSVSARIER